MNKELFETRHIGTLGNDRELMLKEIGIDSIDKLVDLTIPEGIRLKNKLNIPDAMSEFEYLNAVKEIGAKNKVYKTYIGMGYYNTIVPPVIQRNVLENPGWYTAYTPYQAEIAQGRLESLLNFQTMVSDLTGMEIANASLLDESTAAAEAMSMLFNTRKRDQVKGNVVKFFVSEECFPQTIDVVKTRAKGFGIELVIGNHKEFTPTAINVHWDLHCWELTFNWIPIGVRKSFAIRLNIKSPLLKDIKFEARGGNGEFLF